LHGALASAQTPDTLVELLTPRLADLDDDERKLLEVGSLQGPRFLSAVIVSLLNRADDEVLDRLDRIEERRHMIELQQVDDWWSDRSNLYAFEPGVLRDLLYDRYARSRYQRELRHRQVAKAIEKLIAHDTPPPRHALLEIARHYEEAGDSLEAARRFLDVAESTFAEGADRETARNAGRAAALLRAALSGSVSNSDRVQIQELLARAIVLVILGGEPSWHSEPLQADGERLLRLAKDAEGAADAVGDIGLRANTRYATAVVLIAYRGLTEGVAAFREALELAREAQDVVGEFTVLRDLGHQVASLNLREGWELMQQAHALLVSGALGGKLDDRTLCLESARLDTIIGVAAFDLGQYGQALNLLVDGSHALRTARRREDAAWAMAFLAQLYTAIGLYERAEATLLDAIGLFARERGDFGIRGYARALLGHLYLEWEPPRRTRAREELERARDETARSGFRAVTPLVDSYWAELLLAEGTAKALRDADALLKRSATYGWARSEIAACSLRARIALAENRIEDAARLSTTAVEQLRERGGTVPATRGEEMLLTHAQILRAAHSGEADKYAAQAAVIVQDKAASLDDPALRQSFLERVRVSVAALGAHRLNPG
jgi:tetratricopeptide (TPR) repeat protein